jgi:hypothetical protein
MVVFGAPGQGQPQVVVVRLQSVEPRSLRWTFRERARLLCQRDRPGCMRLPHQFRVSRLLQLLQTELSHRFEQTEAQIVVTRVRGTLSLSDQARFHQGGEPVEHRRQGGEIVRRKGNFLSPVPPNPLTRYRLGGRQGEPAGERGDDAEQFLRVRIEQVV